MFSQCGFCVVANFKHHKEKEEQWNYRRISVFQSYIFLTLSLYILYRHSQGQSLKYFKFLPRTRSTSGVKVIGAGVHIYILIPWLNVIPAENV